MAPIRGHFRFSGMAEVEHSMFVPVACPYKPTEELP
jgi:hypothetical protein